MPKEKKEKSKKSSTKKEEKTAEPNLGHQVSGEDPKTLYELKKKLGR